MTKMEVFDLADTWNTLFEKSGNKIEPVITDFTKLCQMTPNDKIYFQKALDAFWSRLRMSRVWIGTTDKKRAGWNYVEPTDIFRVIEKAKLVVITDLGPNTGKKSMRIDSVYGLVKTIRSLSTDVNIFVKTKLDKDLWKEILTIIHNKEVA